MHAFFRYLVKILSFSSPLLYLSSCGDEGSSLKSADDYASADIGYDYLTDTRDSQIYRTVLIGDQTWMAENLNYDTLNGSGSWCYDGESGYCKTYGRLYDWKTALKACPEGWRLPRDSDWVTLTKAIGGEYGAGTALKSKKGWEENEGTDQYGFSALPGGFLSGQVFVASGHVGVWWSATAYSADYGWGRRMESASSYLYWNDNARTGYAGSVRCLKNQE